MVKNIAVVGLGNISKRHRANLKRIFPEATIIAIPARESLENVGEVPFADVVLTNYKEAVTYQLDFALLASPSPFHLKHAEVFLAQNIPLLIEKPVAASYQDALKLQSLVERDATPIAVGYCMRYLASARVVFDTLQSNALGTIYNVVASVGQFLPDWRPDVDFRKSVTANAKLGGGVLLELSHEFDYLQWFFGRLDVLHATLRNTKELQLEVEEIADVILQSEDGVLCYVHLDLLQKKAHRQCTIVGSSGRLDWDIVSNKVTITSAENTSVIYHETDYDKNFMYLNMLSDFYRFINGQDNACIPLSDAVDILSLVDKAKFATKIKRI